VVVIEVYCTISICLRRKRWTHKGMLIFPTTSKFQTIWSTGLCVVPLDRGDPPLSFSYVTDQLALDESPLFLKSIRSGMPPDFIYTNIGRQAWLVKGGVRSKIQGGGGGGGTKKTHKGPLLAFMIFFSSFFGRPFLGNYILDNLPRSLEAIPHWTLFTKFGYFLRFFAKYQKIFFHTKSVIPPPLVIFVSN